MRASPSEVRKGLGPILGLVLVACSPAPSVVPTATPTSPTAVPSTGPTAEPTTAAGLPDLGLANVRTDAATARGAIMGRAGGSISTTSSNGTEYTLTLPSGALSTDTAIALYPVMSIGGSSGDVPLTAGVQFSPDGLALEAPGILTMRLPGGVTAGTLHGIGWQADGANLHAMPETVDGQSITMRIFHFSGAGVSPAEAAFALGCAGPADYPCLTAAFESLLGGVPITRSDFIFEVRSWYRDVVEPQFRASIAELDAHPTVLQSADEDGPIAAYNEWRLYAVDLGPLIFHDARFTIAPELAESKALAASFLLDWFLARNNDCIQRSNEPGARPILHSDQLLALTSISATSWGIATAANRLDLESLLDNLCVQLVIDPGRSYSATRPGQEGTINVKIGYRIGAGPVIFDSTCSTTGDGECSNVLVDLSLEGSSSPFSSGLTDDGGVYQKALIWPAGVDPIKIDIRASLDEAGQPNIPTTGDIARFDRITKHIQRFSFTFDNGFDTWAHGTVGSRSAHPNDWGLAAHLSDFGGVVQLDGRGTPSRPNAWISRSFDLPATTTSLSFRVSPEVFAGTSSIVEARIVVDGVSHSLLDERLSNTHSGPSFRTVRASLSPWAGQHVTIYIEMNDNTPAGTQGFDKEIYIDDVEIATG